MYLHALLCLRIVRCPAPPFTLTTSPTHLSRGGAHVHSLALSLVSLYTAPQVSVFVFFVLVTQAN